MVIPNRYHRQELSWGPEGQEKISNATVAIIGEDSFVFPTALNATLVGLNTRLLITGRGNYFDCTLDSNIAGATLGSTYQSWLGQINPLTRISQLPLTLESESDFHFLERTDAIIDVTNNQQSKAIGLEYALQNRIPFISTASYLGESITSLWNLHHPMTGEKDPFLAWPSGALAVQDAVNFILASDDQKEYMLEEYLERRLQLRTGFTYPFTQPEDHARPISQNLEDKAALVIGVGGQGCFAIPILKMLNYGKVLYMDPDTVEDHNLSRQPIYWDSIGRNKAEVAAEKHNQIAGREAAFPIVEKFDETTELDERVDIIYGMTDNMFSRMLASNYAARNNIPFVSAGSDHSGADISIYVPGKTSCYTHLNESRIQNAIDAERQARLNCNENPDPQVVMSNCFAGSMAAILSAYTFEEDHTPFNGIMTYRPDLNPSLGRLTTRDICECHANGPLELNI